MSVQFHVNVFRARWLRNFEAPFDLYFWAEWFRLVVAGAGDHCEEYLLYSSLLQERYGELCL